MYLTKWRIGAGNSSWKVRDNQIFGDRPSNGHNRADAHSNPASGSPCGTCCAHGDLLCDGAGRPRFRRCVARCVWLSKRLDRVPRRPGSTAFKSCRGWIAAVAPVTSDAFAAARGAATTLNWPEQPGARSLLRRTGFARHHPGNPHLALQLQPRDSAAVASGAGSAWGFFSRLDGDQPACRCSAGRDKAWPDGPSGSGRRSLRWGWPLPAAGRDCCGRSRRPRWQSLARFPSDSCEPDSAADGLEPPGRCDAAAGNYRRPRAFDLVGDAGGQPACDRDALAAVNEWRSAASSRGRWAGRSGHSHIINDAPRRRDRWNRSVADSFGLAQGACPAVR